MAVVEIAGSPAINLIRTGPRGNPPVVFLHGVGMDLTYWDLQIASLCTAHDVVAFDLPNHGLSGRLDAPPTLSRLAAILAGILIALDAGPAHVVGLSVGGMIAQALVLERPDLVRSLTLVGTLCTFPERVREALRERAGLAREKGMAEVAPLTIERWFAPAFRIRRPDVLDRATKSLLGQDPIFHGSMWDMIATLDLEARLPAVTCPTLVVAGSEDVNAPVTAGRLIASLIPGATLHEVQGAGHLIPTEAPEEVNDLLHRFLAA